MLVSHYQKIKGVLIIGLALLVGVGSLYATDRVFYSWYPDTLTVSPGETLNIALMLETDSMLLGYGFSGTIDTTILEWLGSNFDTTAADTGGLDMTYCDYIDTVGAFGGYALNFFGCNPGVPVGIWVAVNIQLYVKDGSLPGYYVLETPYPPNPNCFTNCDNIEYCDMPGYPGVIQIEAVPGDVGCTTILAPPDTVIADSTYIPSARIKNFGPDSAGPIPVICVIDTSGTTIYKDTLEISVLAGEDTTTVAFDPWIVPVPNILYDVTVFTAYPGDPQPGNDTLSKIVYCSFPPGDIGPVSITNPPDTVYIDSIYTPSAMVANFTADSTGSFTAICDIGSGGKQQWADTVSVLGLGGYDTVVVDFAPWTVPEAHVNYTVDVFTVYGLDINPNNDTLSTGIFSTFPPGDVGPIAIPSPPESVYTDSVYVPSAEITNFMADSTGSFTVICTFDSSGIILWADTSTVPGLGGMDTALINFDSLTIPSAQGEYNLTVITQYIHDADATNDTLTKAIYAIVVGIDEQLKQLLIPKTFSLFQSYPNPMTSLTTIFYQIPEKCFVTLEIYDVTGRLVRTLVHDLKEPGYYIVRWDGRTDYGRPVSSGNYFYTIRAGSFTDLKKITVVR